VVVVVGGQQQRILPRAHCPCHMSCNMRRAWLLAAGRAPAVRRSSPSRALLAGGAGSREFFATAAAVRSEARSPQPLQLRLRP
jgi:hypothetical protein